MICHVCLQRKRGRMPDCTVCSNPTCRDCRDWDGRCHECTDNAIDQMQREYDAMDARTKEEETNGYPDLA